MLIYRLATQPDAAYQPVAILDDDPAKRRLRIHGVPVLGGRGQMAEVAASTGARMLVIAIAGGSGTVIHDLTEAAERCGLVPKVIPSIRELLTGGAQIEGVRDPRISDLLGRRAVTADVASVREHIAGKRVLVTGAGGSIGAELCRQLHQLGPAELIMLDRDESALHAVQLALRGRALLDSEETVLADIRDERRVREVFERFRPDIVFHAAALKHLPLLESCPAEALKSNVWGTLTVLKAAADHGVQSFVNISTDKAANPVSVLGYSKRITERLTAYMSAQTGRAYLSVRFGNVLGSRGSVLTALSRAGSRGWPGHGDRPRRQPLLHARRRGGPSRAAGGRDRPGRGGPRARHGRTRTDRRHRAQADRQHRPPDGHRIHRAASRREADRGLARARTRPICGHATR